MRILDRMVILSFLPTLLASTSFFVLSIQMVDLFANLVRYLNAEAETIEILQVQLYFLPKSISYSLPVAILFSVSFSLGTYYSNNELISVFGSGISLYRFVAPLLIIGGLLSIGSFFFEEYVVIDSYRRKNELSRELLNVTRSFSNTNVTVLDDGRRTIYFAEYYNDNNRTLSQLTVLERNRDGSFHSRLDAPLARWNGSYWSFEDPLYFLIGEEGQGGELSFTGVEEERYTASPESFQRSALSVDEMRFDEALRWIGRLQEAGLPYREQLADWYERIAFAFTPFIVTLISASVGSRLRRNILLLSLLISLGLATVYYVSGMVGSLAASAGLLPPAAGAWGGVLLFLILGVLLMRLART
ncbi:MAG: LptF/LptG family permease [Spirochaetaceae bacterium]